MEENDTINLVKHIQSLWKDETFCDVEYRFVSQKSRGWESKKCHRSLLIALSPVLRDCLADSLEEDLVLVSEFGEEILDILYTGYTRISSREQGVLLWEALADLGIDATTSISVLDASERLSDSPTDALAASENSNEKCVNTNEQLSCALNLSTQPIENASKTSNKNYVNITEQTSFLTPRIVDASIESTEDSLQTSNSLVESQNLSLQSFNTEILTLNDPPNQSLNVQDLSMNPRILSVGLTTLIPRYNPFHSSTKSFKSIQSLENLQAMDSKISNHKHRTRKQEFIKNQPVVLKKQLLSESEIISKENENRETSPEQQKESISETKSRPRQIYYLTLGAEEKSLELQSNPTSFTRPEISRPLEKRSSEDGLRTRSEVYKCTVCQEEVYSKISLATHVADYHTSIACDQCEESVNGVLDFVKHKMIHANKEPRLGNKTNVICELCDETFKTNQALKFHLFKHADLRPYQCDECRDLFRTPSTLKAHFTVQHSISKHKCSVCGIQSSTSGKLKIHMRSHTNEKPFQCSFCSFSFKQRSVLTIHEFTHVKSSKFKCDRCDKCFPIRSKYLLHMKRPNCFIKSDGVKKRISSVQRTERLSSKEFLEDENKMDSSNYLI